MSKSYTIGLNTLTLKFTIKMRPKNSFAASPGEYCKSGHTGMHGSGESDGRAQRWLLDPCRLSHIT